MAIIIKNILDNCGVSYSWNMQYADKGVLKYIEQNLKVQFAQLCLSQILNESQKCLCYRIYKKNVHFEKYIELLLQIICYLIYANLDVVVTACQSRQEGGRVFQGTRDSVNFATRLPSVTNSITFYLQIFFFR